MAGERYRSPGSSRGDSRKKQKRHHYAESSLEPEYETDSYIGSRGSPSISSRGSLYAPAASATSSRYGHDHPASTNDEGRSDVSRASRHSHSSHHHHHHGHHHRRRKALPAPDERSREMAVAIREAYPVPTVRSRRQQDLSLSSDELEKVFDDRPRPVSRLSKQRHATRAQQKQQQAEVADRGVLMTLATVLVGLFVCFAEAD
ncbi:unnamed protein product [Discula destructiva]